MADGDQIYVVMTLARQVHGEYCFLRAEKAFKRASKADDLVKKIAKDFADGEGKVKPIKIASPMGETICLCEVGAFQLEVEE